MSPRAASAAEHRLGVLVARGSRRRPRSRRRGSRASSQLDPCRVVGAVARRPSPTCVEAGRAARPRRRRSSGRPSERLCRGRDRRRRADDDRVGPRARAGELPLGLAEHDGRARLRRRRASPRRSPRASRRARRCARGATFVRSDDRARRATFVASSRPPSPASTTATSTLARRELGERGGGQHLELRRAGRSAAARTRSSACSRSASSPSTWIRSLPAGARAARCTRRRAAPRARGSAADRARRRRLAVRADDVDRREARAAGRRASASSARIRSSPNSSGHGESDSSQSVCRVHRARGGSARASRARPRRPRPGAFATKRSFASIPSARAISPAQPLALGLDVRRSPCARSGLTTASKIRCSSPSSCGDARRCGGRSPPPSCTRSSAPASAVVAPSGSGHGATISRDSRAGQVRPDLLGHVRHHRMQQLRAAARAPRAPSRARPRRRRRGAA